MTPVREFHEAFDLERPASPPLVPNPDLVRLRMRLIREEYEEVMAELEQLVHAKTPAAVCERFRLLLKELSDLRYVTEGCAVAFGLPIEEAYAEVHRSNMSKLGLDGRPIRDRGGKVLKGPNYSPADMSPFITIIDHEEASHEQDQ